MSARATMTAVAAACAAGFATAALASATGSPVAHTAAARTITVTAVSDRTVQVAGNAAGHVGDQIVFSEKLYHGRRYVGADRGVCSQAPDADGSHYVCTVSFTLFGRGQILVGGTVNFAAAEPEVAVTGGTGEFRAARGAFTFRARSATRFRDVFQLVAG